MRMAMTNHTAKTKPLNGICVKYIYSACVITKTDDVTILHDPWFTEAIYDGSWFQFPKITNPLDSIGDVDYIFVSHIHPDHYDSKFLKNYFNKFGVKKIIIANHQPNHLLGKMRADGFSPTVLSEILTIGKTSIEIIPHKTGSISDIDSAIIIKYLHNGYTHCIVNVNDINFESTEDDSMLDTLKNKAEKIDILLCGYTGAGPYPQTYYDVSSEEITFEAQKKKELFFARYKKVINNFNARVNIPFAGKYILGGKLVTLNEYRGVSDPVEVLEFDENAVVLADNGGEIDTVTFKPTNERLLKYDQKYIRQRIEELKNEKMDYEKLFAFNEINQLPLKRLLMIATRNAVTKSECAEDYFYRINLPNGNYAIINANKNSSRSIFFTENTDELPEAYSEIIIDPRYLFGLLTHIYHWNNAEIGSQYNIRRYQSSYNRKAKEFLFYLTV